MKDLNILKYNNNNITLNDLFILYGNNIILYKNIYLYISNNICDLYNIKNFINEYNTHGKGNFFIDDKNDYYLYISLNHIYIYFPLYLYLPNKNYV